MAHSSLETPGRVHLEKDKIYRATVETQVGFNVRY